MTDEPVRLVDAVVEDERWRDADIEAVAERAASAALIAAGRDPQAHEISLLACDDTRIASLNAEFRDKPAATNVLSWPAFEDDIPQPGGAEPLFLGDLALAFETCRREAEEFGLSLADHLAHLVVHGVLHLLAYDHVDEREADEMEQFEAKILATLDIANPYSDKPRHLGADAGRING